MTLALFALAVVGLIVISAEVMWHIKLLRREAGRKYIHILTALFVSTWPFFLSLSTITLLSFVLLVGVVLSRMLHVGKSIHTIERLTAGDLLFPVGIGLSSLITTNKWIFCAAMLQIGLADGLAGLVGRHYNVGNYHILGNHKSFLGTATFIATSMFIMFWLVRISGADLPLASLIYGVFIVVPATALAENISPHGIDNITVPLATILLLKVI